jgi:hypothetical protein
MSKEVHFAKTRTKNENRRQLQRLLLFDYSPYAAEVSASTAVPLGDDHGDANGMTAGNRDDN